MTSTSTLGTHTPSSVDEAIEIQEQLRGLVTVDRPLPGPPRLIAGVDVAYAEDSDLVAAAVAVLDADDLSVVESATATGAARFPYVPGLLAFRELPTLLTALDKLTCRPNVVVCDGYGLAHPRRFGLACHFGLITRIPTFGVGKTVFVGRYAEPGRERGDWSELVHDGEVVGRVLRTQSGVKPVFVSAGHLIDLASAAELTLRLAARYRQPETTRVADRACRSALKQLRALPKDAAQAGAGRRGGVLSAAETGSP